MTYLFKNNAASTLAATCNLADTTLTVAAGQGARFPSPGAGQSFLATIQNGSAIEVVQCTGRVADVLTISRAKEGTSAQTWAIGSSLTLRVTETPLNLFVQKPDADLLYAPIAGPISLAADPADGTKATRRSWVESQIAAAVTPAAIRPNARYVGEVIEFCGLTLPAQTIWAAGQAVSRTTYAALFAAMTKQTTGNIVSGNTTINTVADTSDLAVGMFVEGLGITNGTTIVSFTANTIVLSAAPSISTNGANIRVGACALGDGSTTFNVIDRRGTVGVGRDDMGGTAANRVTTAGSGVNGARVGQVGGSQRAQQHNHAVTDPGHGHPLTDPGHEHQLEGGHSPMTFTGGFPLGTYGGGATPLYYVTKVAAATTGISISASTTGISVQTSGDGTSQNMQPSTVCNFVIFTGV